MDNITTAVTERWSDVALLWSLCSAALTLEVALRTPDLSKNTRTRTSCLSLSRQLCSLPWREMDHSYLNQSVQAWRVTDRLVQLEENAAGEKFGERNTGGLIIDSLFTQNLISGQEVEEREADILRPHQTHKLSPRLRV